MPGVTIPISVAVQRLGTLERSLLPRLKPQAGNVLGRALTDARRDFESTSLFPERMRALLWMRKLETTPDGFKTEFGASGMAAIMDQGGKTEPHTIRARRVRALRYPGDIGVMFSRSVQHPGSRFRKRGFMDKAAERAEREIGPALDREAQRIINDVGLG